MAGLPYDASKVGILLYQTCACYNFWRSVGMMWFGFSRQQISPEIILSLPFPPATGKKRRWRLTICNASILLPETGVMNEALLCFWLKWLLLWCRLDWDRLSIWRFWCGSPQLKYREYRVLHLRVGSTQSKIYAQGMLSKIFSGKPTPIKTGLISWQDLTHQVGHGVHIFMGLTYR